MRYLLCIVAVASCVTFSGCNSSKVHQSTDDEWYALQVEKMKKDPALTVHNCPYCRCLKRDLNGVGQDNKK